MMDDADLIRRRAASGLTTRDTSKAAAEVATGCREASVPTRVPA
jgi:hypothetical protein